MKYHPNKSVLFITFAIEQGLLLLNNPLGHLIVKSCLARALYLHPVKICHLLVEPSHIHLIAVVVNPDDVPSFIKCFKTESAHYINALLGRNKRTVWCEGYDSPVVLTYLRALVAICYLYSNPAKDNLEESIDAYPGFSTWRMFKNERHSVACEWLHRPQFKLLTKDSHNLRGYTKRAEQIAREATEHHEFTIEPNAWMEAFGFTDPVRQQYLNKTILERVRKLEKRAAAARIKDKKKVIGANRLINQRFDVTYLSNRRGKRTWCLSEKRSVRMTFITFFKELMDQARQIRKKWIQGDFSIPYPAGLHPASMPKLANVLSLM